MKLKHLFGPVPSRRLGISLGVDLIPYKTCTLNCVYCECGETTDLTITRKEYIPVDSVIAELEDYLKNNPRLDYITFAGSGEPTLHSGLGEIIDYLKRKYPAYRVSILTNGTLFTDPNIRKAVNIADLIIPSLDAASEEVFQKINRPHPYLDYSRNIEGLISLRKEFHRPIWLEIFIVPGLNDDQTELAALKVAVSKIKPDRLQIGTLDRPGAEEWVEAANEDRLKEIALFLKPAELIQNYQQRDKIASFDEAYTNQLLRILSRRPCTVEDLQAIMDLHPAELLKYVNHLLATGRIETVTKNRGVFLKIKNHPGGYA